MDKQAYLKAFYISQIEELIEQCQDPSLLALIYQLLIQNEKETNT